MRGKIEALALKLVDRKANRKILSMVVYIILGSIAFIMTLLNIFTNKGMLTWATLLFALLSLLNVFLNMGGETAEEIALWLFTFEILVLFTFFIITGNPDGFSVLWVQLLPTFGMLLYGRMHGTILSAVMLFELIFFFWIPQGRALLMFDYGDTFLARFPFIYFAFFVLAFFLEFLRSSAYDEMEKMQDEYKEMSLHDLLTGLYNREGLYREYIANVGEKKKSVGFAILDLDDFKGINDNYSHAAGDEVLKNFANLLRKSFGDLTCRWGGEEFAVIYFDNSLNKDDFDAFREKVKLSKTIFQGQSINMTVSIGLCEDVISSAMELEKVTNKADYALYDAKAQGKDIVCVYEKE